MPLFNPLKSENGTYLRKYCQKAADMRMRVAMDDCHRY